MTSFLTLVALDLPLATTTQSGGVSSRKSTWTTGECLCVRTACDIQSGPRGGLSHLE